MSALARYFQGQGKIVAGYDRVSTALTDELIREGIEIHFEDRPNLIPFDCRDPERTLVIFTPAIPESNKELYYFRNRGFRVVKRAVVLGEVFNAGRGIGIAGTHGKTSLSTMLSWILSGSKLGCNAFLGGISKNFKSNICIDPASRIIIAEADEYDRSFLTLFPEMALITAIDADHLDIYQSRENMVQAFELFINQIREKGTLIFKHGLQLKIPEHIDAFTYSLKDREAHYHARNLRQDEEGSRFSIVTPVNIIPDVILPLFGDMNVENAIGAAALADRLGILPEFIVSGLATFKGVKRRFDVQVQTERHVYIDDYAHHPREIDALITSVRSAFPGRKITGIFQPHLFSRTRDFAVEFAQSLGQVDDLILLDIYPAREEPIPGVTSAMIFDRVDLQEKVLINRTQLFRVLKERDPELLLTIGAGDIDQFVVPLRDWLLNKK